MILSLDWEKYQLILFNIVQNAFKYNVPKGFIVIVLRVVQYSPREYLFKTVVIDSGIGIKKETRDNLFVLFGELQAKESFEEVHNSTIGLGLSTSSRIVNKMMGKIYLANNP